jgi:hypothetical protein
VRRVESLDDKLRPSYPLRPQLLRKNTLTGEFTDEYALVVLCDVLFRNNLVGQAPEHDGLLYTNVSYVIESALYERAIIPMALCRPCESTLAEHSSNITIIFQNDSKWVPRIS